MLEPLSERDVAVIAVSGRYPGAANIDAFWNNLVRGRDSITVIPADRWNRDAHFPVRGAAEPEKYGGQWGGFIAGVAEFDPQFFNISPRMAAFIDPQARLFLETVWNLLEASAHTREELKTSFGGKVGVFVGAMSHLYSHCANDPDEIAATALSSYNEIANRVSYFFDLRGPSLALDSMGSSSLTAISLACESLLNDECKLAIAGGVNLSIHPGKYLALSRAGRLASHTGSRSFGDGDGFLPAEGVGAVLLKTLARAVEEGDTILAVIKSSAIRYSGSHDAPSETRLQSRIQLMESHFRRAGIDPDSIGYVEAAANGCRLDDAMEARVLKEVFGRFTQRRHYCPIGSVKANIGDPEAAAGIAQLTKVILQLRHRQWVPSIAGQPLNTGLELAESPFYLLDEPCLWPQPHGMASGSRANGTEYPRRATINSFGATGADAHLIVEEYLPTPRMSGTRGSATTQVASAPPSREIIVLSAKTPDALHAVAQRLLSHIGRRQGESQMDLRCAQDGCESVFSLANVAYTLQSHREAMDCRMALLASDFAELVRGLQQYLRTVRSGGKSEAEPREPGSELPVVVHHGNVETNTAIRTLFSGTAAEAMVRVLLEENRLGELALHWVHGGKIPWQRLQAGRVLRKMDLPTYPFVLRTCWLASANSIPGRGRSATSHEGLGTEAVWDFPAQSDQSDYEALVQGFREAPVGAIERALAGIWLELLGLEQIGRHENFLELGGDSRLGMHVIARVRERMNVELPLRALFEAPTVARLSEIIRQNGNFDAETGRSVAPGGRFQEGVI